MAYRTKFSFGCESCWGTVYDILIEENGYTGSAVSRALGRPPIIRMQDSSPIFSTCCELYLECEEDYEYVDLYTTNPNQYRVSVLQNGHSVWSGFVATELYSEPDIAPRYDVKITATDGLGTLKEYPFVPIGYASVKEHLYNLLDKTGNDSATIYMASRLREYGEHDTDFLDVVATNLDHLAGQSCYEVLKILLSSMRCIITSRGGDWLIVREVDVSISSAGALSVLHAGSASTSSSTLNVGKSIGSMGTSDLWPVGYLTRRVVPAKNAVKVRADWNLRNGAPPLVDWYGDGEYTTGTARYLGNMGGEGALYNMMPLGNFEMDIKVTVRAVRGSVWQNYNGAPYVKVTAMWMSQGGGGTKYYHPDTGWTTERPPTGDEKPVERTDYSQDPAMAEEISFTIPSPNDSNGGGLSVYVIGHLIKVYGIDVELVMMKGYEDVITINNGARGSAGDLSIIGGRETDAFLILPGFVYGVWANQSNQSVITAFSDSSNTNKDWMSLTALAYAKEHAAPRIEVSGKLNHVFDAQMLMPPMFVKSHGEWAIMRTYDWDMLNEDVSFTAVTLPTASLSVTSENVTTVAGNNSPSSSGTSMPGGGGAGLPAVTGSDDGQVLTVVSGAWNKAAVPTELPSVGSTDNGKLLEVVGGQWSIGDRRNDLPTVLASDAGKILRVTDNGFWAVVDPEFMKIVRLDSMAQYNAISQKDPATVYLIGTPSVTQIYLYTQLIWSET